MTEIMKEKKTYYITTPIYYPSAKLHIGHTYCTVNTDALARYKRMRGYDVYFLTGADEHGQKIERKAAEAGVTPQQYVDSIVAGFHSLWQLMDISNDGFVRTTDDYHVACVQKVFKKLYDQGDIYKSSYKGMYCTPCEAFWTETQLKESGGVCPDCGGKVEEVEEESYFLNVSKYAPRLIEYIETHPEFIQPASRAKEMLNNFLLPGLEDLCVSRSTFKWGVPVSFDDRHVIYVWFDAVLNYLSKLGYCTCKADEINAELFHDEKYIRLLVAAFPDVQLADGSIDKAKFLKTNQNAICSILYRIRLLKCVSNKYLKTRFSLKFRFFWKPICESVSMKSFSFKRQNANA